MGTFLDKLNANFKAGKYVCAGLDPRLDKLPPHLVELMKGNRIEACRSFLYALVSAAKPVAAAYKPNWSFFVGMGPEGLALLESLCKVIRISAPNALLILDMKCGDIDSSNDGYVDFAFKRCGVDAVTLHNYMGYAAMKPFLADPDHGAFVLCRTSNPESDEFQGLCAGNKTAEPLYERVAQNVAERWNANGNCGLVTGATYPDDLKMIRRAASGLPLLIPGIGAQGGNVEKTVAAVLSAELDAPFIVNISRTFMHAASDEHFSGAAERAVRTLNDEIANAVLAVKLEHGII